MRPHGGYRGPSGVVIHTSIIPKKPSAYKRAAKDIEGAYEKGKRDRHMGVKFTQGPYYKDIGREQAWKKGWEEESAKQNANQN